MLALHKHFKISVGIVIIMTTFYQGLKPCRMFPDQSSYCYHYVCTVSIFQTTIIIFIVIPFLKCFNSLLLE